MCKPACRTTHQNGTSECCPFRVRSCLPSWCCLLARPHYGPRGALDGDQCSSGVISDTNMTGNAYSFRSLACARMLPQARGRHEQRRTTYGCSCFEATERTAVFCNCMSSSCLVRREGCLEASAFSIVAVTVVVLALAATVASSPRTLRTKRSPFDKRQRALNRNIFRACYCRTLSEMCADVMQLH